MRALAAVTVLVAGAALPLACALTTNLDGLANGAPARDGGLDDPDDARGPNDGAAFDASTTASDVYRSALDVDRPSAHWSFDEPANAVGAQDRINGRVAPGKGALVFGVVGAVGGAAKLSVGDVFEVGAFFDLSGVQPYSIEAWINPDVTPSREFFEFINHRGSAGGYVFYARKNPNEVTVQFEHDLPSGGRGAAASIAPKVWHHVVVTFENGAGIRLFVDGSMKSTGYADPGNAPLPSGALVLGGSFEGLLDEVAIYPSALTAQRVRAHFDSRR